MKILVNRTALTRAIANATGWAGPMNEDQRKAMFARQGAGGPGAAEASRTRSAAVTRTSISGNGPSTTTTKLPALPVKPQPQQPIWDPVAGKWWFPPSVNDPRPTPKPPNYAPIDPTRPIMGIPERPPIGSAPPTYYIPTPTPAPQPKPVPKPAPNPAPAPPPTYRIPPRITLPNNPYLPRPWI